ncbi:pirin family protein [Fulvivirga kasyanovii]
MLALGSMSLGFTKAFSMSSKEDRLTKQVGFNHLPNKKEKTMKTVLHKADTRGYANHGWLLARHTFSFANYFDPTRIQFGALRVLNDDQIAGGRGFGSHPHENMEIITIPLEGDLEHKDSMGNGTVIKEGDVQVMSAGTGIIHSEYNKNEDKAVKLFQIWVFPNQEDVKPRYDQISIADLKKKNEFYQILSPNPDDQGVWIHQDAWFHLGDFETGKHDTYTIKKPGNGVYAFVIEGDVTINGQALNRRDGYGLTDLDQLTVIADSDARVLLMEVPMIDE